MVDGACWHACTMEKEQAVSKQGRCLMEGGNGFDVGTRRGEFGSWERNAC